MAVTTRQPQPSNNLRMPTKIGSSLSINSTFKPANGLLALRVVVAFSTSTLRTRDSSPKGTRILNTLPILCQESTLSWWFSMRAVRSAMARPKPRPLISLVAGWSRRLNSSNTSCIFCAGIPTPVSQTWISNKLPR